MGAGGGKSGDTPGTVLVAEDDDAFRETLSIWLREDSNWEVEEAANGREAIEELDEAVDVLVLDRRMPERTGSKVLDTLDDTGFDGPVIVISAYRPDSNLTEDRVDEYLVKPIDREQFTALLERYG